MNTTTRISTAERLGRTFAADGAPTRARRRASNWLVSKGVPAAVATALVWVVKLSVVGLLLYVAFGSHSCCWASWRRRGLLLPIPLTRTSGLSPISQNCARHRATIPICTTIRRAGCTPTTDGLRATSACLRVPQPLAPAAALLLPSDNPEWHVPPEFQPRSGLPARILAAPGTSCPRRTSKHVAERIVQPHQRVEVRVWPVQPKPQP